MRGGSFVGNEESLQACAICLCLTGILQARSLSLRFCLSLSYTSSISRRRLPTCHHCPSSSPPRARCSIKSLASCTHCSCVSRTRLSSSSSRKNPPSIPTLALVWLVARLRGSKVIIDWHNLGYSILALKLGDKHPLVRIAKQCAYR